MKFKTDATLSEDNMMEEDKKIQEALDILTKSVEHWVQVKKILTEDIRATQELIIMIDKIIQDREDKYSKLN